MGGSEYGTLNSRTRIIKDPKIRVTPIFGNAHMAYEDPLRLYGDVLIGLTRVLYRRLGFRVQGFGGLGCRV